MNSKKISDFFLKHFYLIIFLIAVPYMVAKALVGGDFKVYLAAAEQLRLGHDCYNKWLNYEGANWYSQYSYSPLFALILIPFTFFPAFVPQFLFLIADVFMLFRIFNLIGKLLETNSFPKRNLWLILVLAFSLRFILHNFEMVQLNILLLWLSLEGLYLIFFEERNLLGAFVLALGINFKIMPLVFIPYLIFRKKIKALAFIFLFSLIFILSPAFFLGNAFNLQLHKEWVETINPLRDKYNAGQNVETFREHGLAALFSSYFLKNTGGGFQWLISPLNKEFVNLLINLSRMALILITFFFLKMPPFNSGISKKQFLTETAYIFLVTPLIFPQQSKHGFVTIIPALAVIFFNLLQKKEIKNAWFQILLLIIVFVLTVLTTYGIVGVRLNYYIESLKLVTVGALFLVPLLMISYKHTGAKK